MSETFDPGWLALREPVDHRSRAEDLLAPLRAWWSAGERTEVVDLGSGTGSNLRYLERRLRGRQRWTLVDQDDSLLARVVPAEHDVEVRRVHRNFSDASFPEVAAAHLVTASALLDLVSARWLRALVDACVTARCAALFALSYDGRIEWTVDDAIDPMRLDDAFVRDAVNEHQLRDKGFGPSLGPSAGRFAEDLFARRGYRTLREASDWRLGEREAAITRALIDGWENAAMEQRPSEAERIRRWAARRRAWPAGDGVALVVGHVDVLALPEPA